VGSRPEVPAQVEAGRSQHLPEHREKEGWSNSQSSGQSAGHNGRGGAAPATAEKAGSREVTWHQQPR
jgi:hypothetical protein